MVRAFYRRLKVAELPCLYEHRPGKQSTVDLVGDTLDYLVNLKRFRRELANGR